jgi:hypothetical protein
LGKKGKGGPRLTPKKVEQVPLYRVFNKETDKLVYIGSGEGLELAEAERLSKALAVETYVKQVFFPQEEEE